MNKEYDDSSIQVLQDREHIRLRASRYISPECPSHQVYNEIADNAIDEAMNGFADHIKIDIDYENSHISIEDNGRGLPQGMNTKMNKPTIYAIYTKLHAGGKFDQEDYIVSGGLHGEGSTIVNALSKDMKVTTWRDGSVLTASFKYGEDDGSYKKYNDASPEFKKSGTRVEYTIDTDHEIFADDHLIDYKEAIESKLTLLKTLLPDVTFTYNGQDIKEAKFTDFVDLSPNPLFKESIYIKTKSYMLAFNWSKDNNKCLYKSYCNSIYTPNGGDHVGGVHNAMIKLFGDDALYGLTLALSVNYSGVEYEGQAKVRALSKTMKSEIMESVLTEVKSYMRSHPDDKKAIYDLLAYKRAEIDKRKNKSNITGDRKSAFLNTLGVTGFADCRCRDRSNAELYIVEGNSAGGSAVQARSVDNQAILPIRGKFINAYNSTISGLLGNAEVSTLLSSIGAGAFQDFDITRCRYSKVIIFTDADPDGENIACLLISFFLNTMPELVAAGRLYLALPPLYGTQDKKGNFIPIHDEETKNRYLSEGYRIQRYKGLGEMNPDQLRMSCMDPKTRQIIKIELTEDCLDQVSKIMGSDPTYRKQLLKSTGVLR